MVNNRPHRPCMNVVVLKRWFAAMAVFGCMCTLYLSNPSFVAQTLAKMDLYTSYDKSKPVVPIKLMGTADILTTVEYCVLPEILHFFGASKILSTIPLLPLDDHFVKCLTERQYQVDPPKILNFGVFPESWNRLVHSVLQEISVCPLKFQGNCLIRNCDGNVIRLMKLQRTSDFYTVPVCNSSRNEIAQLVLQIKPNNLIVHSNVTLSVPFDLTLFHLLLKNSKFIECDLTLAKNYKRKYPSLFKANNSGIVDNFDWIVSIRNLLYSVRMTPMLAGGSLLGWRRECGIISFTHDFDFAVPIEQYNAGLEDLLKKHHTIKLKFKFGKPSDSLEYTLMDHEGTRADIFFLYEEKNYSWVGGLGLGKQKIKYVYPPLTEVCSTYLMGYLFHVPCNPEEFIRADYGVNWTEPNKAYKWYKYGTNNGLWDAKEWAEVFVKYF